MSFLVHGQSMTAKGGVVLNDLLASSNVPQICRAPGPVRITVRSFLLLESSGGLPNPDPQISVVKIGILIPLFCCFSHLSFLSRRRNTADVLP